MMEEKHTLRSFMKERRMQAALQTPEAVNLINIRLLKDFSWAPGTIVAGYWPVQGEVDIRPALEALHHKGLTCALPVVVGREAPLVFRQWTPGMALGPGPFHTLSPPETAPVVQPSVLLVPLLAFDRQGHRLGYGLGFYDRTLASLREKGSVLAIGVGYQFQEVDSVPHDSFDQPLDWIVTEELVWRVKEDE